MRRTRCDCRGGEPDVLAARIAALGARTSEPESESRLRRQGGGMIALRHSASSKTEKPACQGAFVKLCHLQKIWSGRRGSNPRPRPWQGRALPLSYTRVRKMLAATRGAGNGRPMPNAAGECNAREGTRTTQNWLIPRPK